MVSLRDQWRAWREDYRSERPAVNCDGCGTHYPRGKDTGNATYIGYALKSCGECERRKRNRKAHFQARLMQSHKGIRKIGRDVAIRYMERYGGETFVVQTAIDEKEIYLRNAFGLTIASISIFDTFPKPVEIATEIPY